MAKLKTISTMKVTAFIDGPAISNTEYHTYKGAQVQALIDAFIAMLRDISIQCGMANVYRENSIFRRYGRWYSDQKFDFPDSYYAGVDLTVEYFLSPVPVGDAGTDELRDAATLFEEKLVDFSLHEGAYSLTITKLENGTWPED